MKENSNQPHKLHEQYQNPLTTRYASKEMSYIFSADYKYKTWRRLWLALAEAEKNQGLDITDAQLQEMQQVIETEEIDYEMAALWERKLRHDVMAHIHTFADRCPKSASILHLGATSAYVTDNTDLIQMKAALQLLRQKILSVIKALRDFAFEHRILPTLGYTHYQVAQPTTVGKRACLWLQELLLDFELLNFVTSTLPFRGIKGTTGTLASFKTLFDGDEKKVLAINQAITEQFGFVRSLTITGQTYTRKLDSRVLSFLSSIAESASKFAVDMRLLQHENELAEPFAEKQVGSSAMAYKQNPMLSERIGSLGRFVMALRATTEQTAAQQWLERTLDDSANKRLSISQAFLAVDAILDIYHHIASGIRVHPAVIMANLKRQIPFLITENILMASLNRNQDNSNPSADNQTSYNRQTLHERIRLHSLTAKKILMENVGKENPLLNLIADDKHFPFDKADLQKMADPKLHIGFSSELTVSFLKNEVDPLLKNFKPSARQEPKV